MKLSPFTIDVLKNFCSINVNLAFQPGKIIRTLGPARNIFAKAIIEDDLPQEFAIYDLTSFIQAITLFDDAELELHDKFVLVKYGTNSAIKYFYSDPSIVVAAPNKEIVLDEQVFTCDLAESTLNALMKVSAVLAAPQISIVSNKGNVVLLVSDVKNATSHSYKTPIGESKNSFNVILRVENFKLMPGNYTMTVGKKIHKDKDNSSVAVVHWKNKDKPLEYFMTVEQGSTV